MGKEAQADTSLIALVFAQVTPWLKIESPRFGSYEATQLDCSDPVWIAGTVKAGLAWWSAVEFGDGVTAEGHRIQLAEASRAIHSAAPALWRRVANDRATGRPQGRARRTYGPCQPLLEPLVPAGSPWRTAE